MGDTKRGTVITVEFLIPTENNDEAFQAVHNLIEDNGFMDIYDWDQGQWFYGMYDIKTTTKEADFEVDEDNHVIGVQDEGGIL